MSRTGSTKAPAAWLLLSEISSFKPKLDHKAIIECCNKYMSEGECSLSILYIMFFWLDDFILLCSGNEELLCRVLKVIENIAADISVDIKEDLTGTSSRNCFESDFFRATFDKKYLIF
jgi:hypothetical protein